MTADCSISHNEKLDKRMIAAFVLIAATVVGIGVKGAIDQDRRTEERYAHFWREPVEKQFESAASGLVAFKCVNEATGIDRFLPNPVNIDAYKAILKDRTCRMFFQG